MRKPQDEGVRLLSCKCFCLLPTVYCLLVLPIACQQPQTAAPPVPVGVPLVRVRLLNDVPQIKLKATSFPSVRVAAGPSQQLSFPPGAAVPVTRGPAGWQVGSLQLGPGELTIIPDPDGSVSVDGHAYHGQYRLVPSTAGKFDVVNHVDVESYLKGVLAREMMPDFAPEAYKAQAVVARTYAIYESRFTPPGRSWDLYPDDRSQVYGGISSESAKSRAATDETRGWVVASGPAGQEKIFKAYFSSCCGGATQSAADAFGDAPSEPFSEQVIGPRCNVGAGIYHAKFNWGPIVIGKEELARRVRLFGKSHNRPERNIDAIQRVEIFRLNPVGRPTQFTMVDGRGTPYLFTGEDLRRAVNTDAAPGTTLYSSFVTPVTEPTLIRFENGHGFGHGAGLCQWCAQAEAQQGVSYPTIVVSAYKGSKLIKAY